MAHVFIAAARAVGLPARYVSGHLLRADGAQDQAASHAWAEAAIPSLGWVGFDPANRMCPTDAYVRVAVGLDYLDAAPVRARRSGGGTETMTVKLTVAPAWSQSQRQSQGGQSQSQSQSQS
jgi:transglutaminase-like putative cysteine protease